MHSKPDAVFADRIEEIGARRIKFNPDHVTNVAAEVAVAACHTVPGVILPFPGGVVRSGSKIGSKYKALKASTNEAYCPTLRGAVNSSLPDGANAMYELVIDGLSLTAVEAAMWDGMVTASRMPGVMQISAGNYGGNLGPFHLHLHKLLEGDAVPSGNTPAPMNLPR